MIMRKASIERKLGQHSKNNLKFKGISLKRKKLEARALQLLAKHGKWTCGQENKEQDY